MKEVELLSLAEQFRVSVTELLGDEHALVSPSLALQGFQDPELGMLRLASWLYSLQNETAKDALSYLLETAWHSPIGDLLPHMALVRQLRTYFQHHLTSSVRDELIRTEVEAWMAPSEAFDGNDPTHWEQALTQLTEAASKSMLVLISEAEKAVHQDTAGAVSAQWSIFKERAVPPHVVDSRIEALAEQIGLENLNAKAFRERHYSTWKKNLQLLNASVTPADYLDGLIERELLNLRQTAPMPVSGEDVMDAFGLYPGPEVGKVLRTISTLHSESGGTKEALLRRAAEVHGLKIFLDPPVEVSPENGSK